jgi:hypothetical protein
VKNGIIGSSCEAYEVPAAVNDAMDPASVMPSSRIWPSLASTYARRWAASTGSYSWPWGA